MKNSFPSINKETVECFPKGHLNPSDLLPSDKASEWSHANPVGKGSLEDQNFLNAVMNEMMTH